MANWEDAPVKASGGWEDAPSKAQPSAKFSAANVGLAALAGLTGAGKSLTDIFGADNPVSRKLGEAAQYLEEAKTPERKAEIAHRQKIEEEASKSGELSKIIPAYVGAFTEAPIETAANLGGAAIPFIAAGAESAAAKLGLTGLGALMGAGGAKGAIYESVYNASKAAGDSEEVARTKANKEQSYSEHPLGIATAAGLGIGSALGGAAQTANAAIRKRLGKEVAEQAVDSYTKAAAKEATAMGAQSAQSQALQNQALTGAGYETPTTQGVLGAGLTGAISGAAFGAGAKYMHPNVKEVQKTESDNAPLTKPTDPLATVDPNTSYADLHRELAALKAQPDQTPEVQTRAALLADHIKDRDIAVLQQERAQREQAQADAEKAAQSAFSQPNQPVLSRTEGETQAAIQAAQPVGPAMQGDLFADQNLPTEAPPVTPLATTAPVPTQRAQYQYKAPLRNQIKPADLPVPQPLPTKPLGELVLKPEDITNTGVQHGPGVAKWLQENIVGRTLDEVKAMVSKDPKLVEGKGQRTQVLKELLNPAPEVPAYKEPENVARPVSEPVGTSPVVAGEPSAKPTAGGLKTAEPSGVAPVGKAVGKPVIGEGPQPSTLTAREPTERQQKIAFAKNIGATYGERLNSRNNNLALDAVKRGDFGGVIDALANSKNPVISELANRAKDLRTKVVIDDNAEEIFEGRDAFKDQSNIDMANNHLNVLEKLRELAPRVENLPDGAHLPSDIHYASVDAYHNGEKQVAPLRLASVADMNHSMWQPMNLSETGRKFKNKEAFKELHGEYERITNEVGEHPLKLTSTASSIRRGVAGAYDHTTDTIRVPEYWAKDEGVLAHEVMHAHLSDIVANPNKTQKPIVDRLNKLYTHVKKVVDAKEAESTKYYRKPYGAASIQEFLAEGLSNPRFKYELSRIKYENTTALGQFAETIAKLLGIKNDNAFTELLNIYDDLTKNGNKPTLTDRAPVALKGGDREAAIRSRLQEVINNQNASKAEKRAAIMHMDNLDKTTKLADDAHTGKMNLVEDYLDKHHPAGPSDAERQAEATKVQAALEEAQKQQASAPKEETSAAKVKPAPPTTTALEDVGSIPRMNPFEAAAKREPLYTEEQQKARDARIAAARNSILPEGAQGQTLDEFNDYVKNKKGVIGAAMRRLIASGKLKIEAAHPDDIQKGGLFDGKTVTLYANALPKGYELPVMLHEIAAHMGMKNLVGENAYNGLIDRVQALVDAPKGSPERKLAQAAFRRIPEEDIARGANVARDEHLAYFVEEMAHSDAAGTLPKAGAARILWDRIKALSVSALNKALGTNFGTKHFTPDQISTLAKAAFLKEALFAPKGEATSEASRNAVVRQAVPESIERDAAYLKPKATTTRDALKSMYEGSKAAVTGQKDISTITKIRTQVTDRWAAVRNRIQDAYDNKMESIMGKADPRITVQQAQDVDRMLPSIFERGGLEINPVTRQLEVTDADSKPVNILSHIKDYAAATGRDYETAYANASHILEGLRVAELIKENATKGAEHLIHKDWRNADGSYNQAKIKDAETAYRNSPELQKINKVMDDFRIRLVDMMEKTGRLNSHDAEVWRTVSHYVPFDRIEDLAKVFTGSKRTGRKGLAQLGALPKFVGSMERKVGNVFENYYKTMGWMVDQIAKQNANSHMLDTLVDLGIGKNIGQNENNSQTGYTAPIYRKGVKEFVDLPSMYDALPFVDKAPPKRWYVAAMGKVAPITRKFVTANPAFAAKQVFEDVQGALITANVHNPARFIAASFGNFGKLAFHEMKGYVGDLTGRQAKVHDMERMMRNMGLAGEVDYTSYNPGESLMYDMGIRKRGATANLIHRLERITHSSDLAVRKALYDDEIRHSNDQLMASAKARELINFRNSGANTLMRDLVSVVPFLNSTAQSLDIMYRAATGVDAPSGLSREAAKAMFRKNMMIYAGLSLAYAMAKSGDDEYEKMNRRMRDNNWIMGDGVRIPIRGDMAIAKVAIENAVGYFRRQGTPEEQLASEAVKTAMAYAWSQTGERVAAAPIPLAVRPLLEIVTNHSFLTGRELEGTYQKTLMPHERETSATSFPAKALSNAIYEFTKGQFGLDVSPIHIDQAVNGYFGAVPSVVNMLTDAMLNPGSVDRPMSKWMGISGYAYDESNLTNPKDEFYNLQERVMPVLKTLQDLSKRDPAQAEQFIKDHQEELALAKPVQHALSQLSKIRQYENVLKSPRGAEIEPNMAERQRQIAELNRTQNEIVSWVREAQVMMRNQ